ncbi:hypothetical protein QJS10_CPB18g01091 [Acorus calamus]|uniref:Uncharacterized protein n=1 Tax=Acorus calamus TaxID=4465 RepID=A0AAV9CNW1_ACOCL|nr:hypothetical protein QJS10_CPB18g01091 [Acorus calamus]
MGEEEEKNIFECGTCGRRRHKNGCRADSSAENASPLNPKASIGTIEDEEVLVDKDGQSLPDPVINEAPVTDEVKKTSDSVALSETLVPNEVKSESVGYEEVVSQKL